MPNDYIKKLPRFSGSDSISTEGFLDVFWWYMESRGAEDEDVFMRSLGASLDGDAKLWFDHLEPGSITGYDMFTDLIIEEWGVDIKQSIEEQLGDDCVNEDQFDANDQENNDEIIDDCPSGFDFSSPEPMMKQ